MKNYRIIFLFVLLAAFSTVAIAQKDAQKDKDKSKAAPSPTPVVPQVFISSAEKFSIDLPAKPTVTRDIKAGEMFGVASGKQYTWAMQEGKISVARAIFDEPMRGERDFLDFAAGMKESVEMGSAGKVLANRVEKTGTYRLVEIFFTVPDGRLMLTRWHVSNTEYFNIMAELKKDDPEDKAAVIKIMDTFKLLDQATPAGTNILE